MENPADVKAAKRLAKLYDAILAANQSWSDGNHTHELNLFMTRILFCFYAEDTGIFETPHLFTNSVAQQTKEDGSDAAPFLDRLFRVMNLRDDKRPMTLAAVDGRFPYVNGSLFENTLAIPSFSRTTRRQFLECGELDWQNINPDIFGSMIQTITQPGARGEVGMHYTSVPNIMKVLQPLFLDDLNDAYEKAKESVSRLEALLARLAKIRVFDPACGSGNFLIIAYKELRQIEMRILGRLAEIAPNAPLRFSSISLDQFYGIDYVDFACETAKLSLWIAEHQMNRGFKELFGKAKETLPLGRITNIHHGNALHLDWSLICPTADSHENYICGNPPYQGSVGQTDDQKRDITEIFSPILKSYRDVDYVSCWFIRLTQYIAKSTSARGAFVATNSITQGEQVPFMWPYIYRSGIDIFAAHRSFKWGNSASHNAGVTCVIVGLASKATIIRRTLYTDGLRQEVGHINPYLVPAEASIVTKEQNAISGLPEMTKGSVLYDDGHLTLTRDEANRLKTQYPESARFIRRFYGAEELLYDTLRYVLWIPDDELEAADAIPPVVSRVEKVRQYRLKGGTSARAVAHVPHKFGFVSYRASEVLVLPQKSSERRQYLQVAMLGASDVPSQSLCVIYDPPPFILALLSSRLHWLWMATIGGRMETRFSYSNTVVYNTFPVPDLSSKQKRILADHSKAILKARVKHHGKTLAWLYNPETMPADLLEVHQENDAYFEEYVYGRKFKDDTQRLAHLFTMYATITSKKVTPLFGDPAPKRTKAHI